MNGMLTLIPFVLKLSLLGLLFWSPSSSAMDAGERAVLDELKSLENRIEALSAEHGMFSMALFEPLLSLAGKYFDQGRLDDTEDTLRRAQNVAHRNEGVYTPTQLEIVERLTDIALAEDEFPDANQQKKFAFFITTHHLGEDNPEILYAYAEIADWYMNTGQPLRARRLLEEATDLARENNLETIAYTLMIDKARRLQGLCCSTKHLTEIIESRDKHATDPDSLAFAYMTIGDAFVLARKTEDAEVFYRLAHELTPLRGDDEPQPITIKRSLDEARQNRIQAYQIQNDPLITRNRLRRMTAAEQLEDEMQPPQWFILDAEDKHIGYKTRDLHETSSKERRTQTLVGNPIKFEDEQLNHILPHRLHSRHAKTELMIEMSFSVTETGDLKNIKVMESNAPVKLNRLLIETLKKAYFRPALVKGTPVATDRVTLVQTFPATQEIEWE